MLGLRFLSFVLVLILLSACQQDVKTDQHKSKEEVENNKPTTPSSEQFDLLVVNVDNLRIRSKASLDAQILTTLNKRDTLYYLNEKTNFSTQVRLRGIDYNEPWLKVKTLKGQLGWVFGGGIRFLNDSKKAQNTLLEHRLNNFLGYSLAEQSRIYRQAFENANTDSAFAVVFTQGQVLRDTLVEILQEKIEVDYTKLPDLFWLEEAIPCYKSQLVAEGTTYYLFMDYKDWAAKAKTTKGELDDGFIDLCFLIHGLDSVEYFFPSWFIQTWDYGGHCLLGQGIQYEVLNKMDSLYQTAPLFRNEIMVMKQNLLSYITTPHYSYWESQASILEELDKIIKANFSIITSKEKIELNGRYRMFQNYKVLKIELGQKF